MLHLRPNPHPEHITIIITITITITITTTTITEAIKSGRIVKGRLAIKYPIPPPVTNFVTVCECDLKVVGESVLKGFGGGVVEFALQTGLFFLNLAAGKGLLRSVKTKNDEQRKTPRLLRRWGEMSGKVRKE